MYANVIPPECLIEAAITNMIILGSFIKLQIVTSLAFGSDEFSSPIVFLSGSFNVVPVKTAMIRARLPAP